MRAGKGSGWTARPVKFVLAFKGLLCVNLEPLRGIHWGITHLRAERATRLALNIAALLSDIVLW